MIKYRNHLYKKNGRRGASNVLEDTELKNRTIESVNTINNQVIFKVQGDNHIFVVDVDNVFDEEVGEAASLRSGDIIYAKYGDQKNSKTVPVRLLKIVK